MLKTIPVLLIYFGFISNLFVGTEDDPLKLKHFGKVLLSIVTEEDCP